MVLIKTVGIHDLILDMEYGKPHPGKYAVTVEDKRRSGLEGQSVDCRTGSARISLMNECGGAFPFVGNAPGLSFGDSCIMARGNPAAGR